MREPGGATENGAIANATAPRFKPKAFFALTIYSYYYLALTLIVTYLEQAVY